VATTEVDLTHELFKNVVLKVAEAAEAGPSWLTPPCTVTRDNLLTGPYFRQGTFQVPEVHNGKLVV